MSGVRIIECVRLDGGYLLWPGDEPRPPAAWCDESALASAADVRTGGRGRGNTLYFDIDGRTLVLRRYHRGGMVQRLGDRYLRLGLRRSRAWRELALLIRLHREGLPVPRPVAAKLEPVAAGSPFLRQVLVTEYLPRTRTLTEVLRQHGVGVATWRNIGSTVARMHAAGVDHADLNAHNILLDEHGEVHLIDFDRGRFRRAAGSWQTRNLRRLHRSLEKLSRQESRISFSDSDWEAIGAGYRSQSDSAST